MPRAQCIVRRGSSILMVKHRVEGVEWWCLPGGRIQDGESPAEAAVRELSAACQVRGSVVRETSVTNNGPDDRHHTFLVDIGDQQPSIGDDPERPGRDQALVEARWLPLDRIPERDRAYLWAAGLLGVEGFATVVEGWGDALSYPG